MTLKRIVLSLVPLVLAGSVFAAPHNRRVFTLSNESSGNRLLVFDRSADGRLQPAGSVDAGGLGSGGGLGNQGALAMSRDGHWLVGVNAGSDTITLFENKGDRPERRQVVPSRGRLPVSVAVADDLVFVLNAGGSAGASDSVAGFKLAGGRLRAIPGAVSGLSAASTGPAQIGFADGDDVLVVSEKATDRIDTFMVRSNGTLEGPIVHQSAGRTPFGFAVADGDRLIVSEAQGGAPNISSASSYEVDEDGQLRPITLSLALGQLAACWVAVSRDGRFAYTANAASGSLSGLVIGDDGDLSLLDASGLTASTAPRGTPVDETFSRDGKFLYVLSRRSNTIAAFRAARDGSLEYLDDFGQLPPASTGIVAR